MFLILKTVPVGLKMLSDVAGNDFSKKMFNKSNSKGIREKDSLYKDTYSQIAL